MRASKRQLAIACPSSALPCEYQIEVAREPSEQGSAAHAGIAHYVEHGALDYDAIQAAAEMQGRDADEDEKLVERAVLIWRRIKPDDRVVLMRPVEVEVPLAECWGMTGTPDVRWASALRAVIVDWKFGRERRDCYHQLAQYAVLYREQLRAQGLWGSEWTIAVHARWVRLGEHESRVFDDQALDAWLEYATEREHDAGKVYSPGDHCGFCPHVVECRPRQQWLAASATALSVTTEGAGKGDELDISPAMLGMLYDRSKAVGRALDAYKAVLSSALDAGPVPLPDGRVLERGHRRVRQIDADAALAELERIEATDDERAGVIKTTASMGALDKLVRARAPRGTKKEAVDAMNERLESSQRLRYRDDKIINVRGANQ